MKVYKQRFGKPQWMVPVGELNEDNEVTLTKIAENYYPASKKAYGYYYGLWFIREGDKFVQIEPKDVRNEIWLKQPDGNYYTLGYYAEDFTIVAYDEFLGCGAEIKTGKKRKK